MFSHTKPNNLLNNLSNNITKLFKNSKTYLSNTITLSLLGISLVSSSLNNNFNVNAEPTNNKSEVSSVAKPVEATTPTPAQPTCTTNQFKAEYFNMDNVDTNGRSKWQTEDLYYNPVLATDCVDKIDFRAWNTKPLNPATNGDFFSSRYTGDFDLTPGKYEFNIVGDDIAKLYINNNLVGKTTWEDMTNWNPVTGGKTFEVTIPATSSTTNIKVEHKDGVGAAVVKLNWEKVGDLPKQETTPATPVVTQPTCTTNQFKAEYFNMDNVDTNGRSKWQTEDLYYNNVSATECLDNLNLVAWDNNPFNSATNGNFFSSRYTGDFSLTPGIYEFNLVGDDFIKLYINNNLVEQTTWEDITNWSKQEGGKTVTVTIPATSSTTNIKVEHKDGVGASIVKLSWARVGELEGKDETIEQILEKNSYANAIVSLDSPFASSNKLREGLSKIQDEVIASLSSGSKLQKFSKVPGLYGTITKEDYSSLIKNEKVLDVVVNQSFEVSLSDSISRINGDKLHNANPTPYTGNGYDVAVLDTGVDYNHPFLANKLVAEGCFSLVGRTGTSTSFVPLCPDGGSVSKAQGSGINCGVNLSGCEHGTHVAGIAVGRNGPNGMNGVAPNAGLVALQVFHRQNNSSACSSTSLRCILTRTSDYVSGLEYVYDLKQTTRPNLISANLSLGGSTKNNSYCSGVEEIIISELRKIDVATVVSSGNDSFNDGVSLPACFAGAVTVGSTRTADDTVSNFSNLGPQLDFYAPGESINSSITGAGYRSITGTSMAAPHVAGAFAVLKEISPNATIDEIEEALRVTGKPITSPRNPSIIRPRIDLCGAATYLNNNQPVDGCPTPTIINPCLDTGSPQTYVVTNNNAKGSGSLYEAVQCANKNTGKDRIEFNIPGSITITANGPDSAISYLNIRDSVVIDGTTQPGYSETNKVVIDGNNIKLYESLIYINADNVEIKGLSVVSAHNPTEVPYANATPGKLFFFKDFYAGITIAGSNNLVTDSYIGIKPDKTISSNYGGLLIESGQNNLIEKNNINGNVFDVLVIGYNNSFKVDGVTTTSNNQIIDNIIGLDFEGNINRSNNYGVSLFGTESNIIKDNTFGNHLFGGVFINNSSYNIIENNTFGLDLSGNKINTTSIGISLKSDNIGSYYGDYQVESSTTNNNIIRKNIITNSSSDTRNRNGIQASLAPDTILKNNTISENSIYQNSNFGIRLSNSPTPTLNDPGDLDSGPNNLYNFPVLTSIEKNNQQLIAKGCSRPGAKIEFFISDNDPSGFGEGKTYLFTGTDGGVGDLDNNLEPVCGDASTGIDNSGTATKFEFRVNLTDLPSQVNSGDSITTTATDPEGNTSEFSKNITIQDILQTVDIEMLDVTFSKNPANPGDTVEATLKFRNNGPNTATNVKIDTQLSASLRDSSNLATTLVSSTVNATQNPVSGSFELPQLNSQQEGEIVYSFVVGNQNGITLPAQYTARGIYAGADQTDTNEPNGIKDGEITIENPPIPQTNLSTTKTSDKNEYTPGEEITYKIAIQNQGPSDATNVKLDDVLNSNLTFVSSNCPKTNNTYDFGTITNGATKECEIKATSNQGLSDGTTIPNTTSNLVLDQTDTNNADNVGSKSILIKVPVPVGCNRVTLIRASNNTETCYTTINEAIANAIQNDIVRLKAGEYKETVVITKPINLFGPNSGISPNDQNNIAQENSNRLPEAIINPDSRGIIVESSNVVIDGITISTLENEGIVAGKNFATGAGANADPNNVTIRNTRFIDVQENNQGSAVHTISDVLLRGWSITRNRSVNRVTKPDMSVFRLQNVSNSNIAENYINGAGRGIQLDWAVNVSVINNTIENVAVVGVQIANTRGPLVSVSIQNNTIRNFQINPQTKGAVAIYGDSTQQLMDFILIVGNTLDNTYNGVTTTNANNPTGGNITNARIIVRSNTIRNQTNFGIYNPGIGTFTEFTSNIFVNNRQNVG